MSSAFLVATERLDSSDNHHRQQDQAGQERLIEVRPDQENRNQAKRRGLAAVFGRAVEEPEFK